MGNIFKEHQINIQSVWGENSTREEQKKENTVGNFQCNSFKSMDLSVPENKNENEEIDFEKV